jgi:hypothetical protein
MKTKVTCMVVGIITMTLLGISPVFAQGVCSRIDMIPGIILNDAQKAKLQASDLEHQKKMIRLHADFAVAELEKDNLIKDKNFKKDAVEKKIHKIMAVKTDMELEKLSEINDLRTVLTDDQWKIFVAHMGSRGMCGAGGFGMGMGMMHGKGGMAMGGMGHEGHGMGMKNHSMGNGTDNE